MRSLCHSGARFWAKHKFTGLTCDQCGNSLKTLTEEFEWPTETSSSTGAISGEGLEESAGTSNPAPTKAPSISSMTKPESAPAGPSSATQLNLAGI